MNTEERTQQIIEYLETVMDPELGIDIWSMGLVRTIDVQSECAVDITMTLTTPACPLGPQIKDDIIATLGAIGYTQVTVAFTFDPPWKPPANLREMLGI